MKAAVFYEPKRLQLENRPPPKVGPGDVLVQISACSVGGTDLHIFDGEAKVQPPVIMGHEYAGKIVEIGSSQFDQQSHEEVE
jgi:threonine dehydrogenase-like Zn-dependent dehydrogenase